MSEFKYLGSIVSTGCSMLVELKTRLREWTRTMGQLADLGRERRLNINVRVGILQSLVVSGLWFVVAECFTDQKGEGVWYEELEKGIRVGVLHRIMNINIRERRRLKMKTPNRIIHV